MNNFECKRKKNSIPIFLILILTLGLISGCSNKLEAENTLDPSGEKPPNKTPSSILSGIPAITEPPAVTNPKDTEAEIITKLIEEMTLEQKVGQLFFVRCPGGKKAIEDIKTYHLGGYVLFASDFQDKTKQQVIDTIASYQNSSELPLLIGVDEEGGTVTRVSKFKEFRDVPFSSPQQLYELGGMEEIKRDTKEKATLLKEIGICVNLAPVCDVTTDPKAFMYKRTFGKGAEETAEYVKEIVKGMKEENIGSVLKHFPGYGNNLDTHTDIAVDERTYEEFTITDFLPFTAGITEGADAVLVSHNVINCIDSELPASLSEKIHQLIREELSFEGVIMTDDLVMDAIRKYTGGEEAAVLAVLAGNDLLIATDYELQYSAVLTAVKDGRISEEIIDKAVKRILEWKKSLLLF